MSANLGIASASAKFSFKQKCKVTKEATFAVLRFSLLNAFETFLETPKLTEEAETLLRVNNMKRFHEIHGDCFCSGGYKGGDFFGSIRIESETLEKGQSIAAEIGAGYAFFKANGKVSSEMQEKTKNEKIEIFTLQQGGKIDPVFSLAELFAQAKDAAKQMAHGNGVPILFSLDRYNELELPGDNVSFIERQQAQAVQRKLAEHYRALMELQNDIDFVLRNPNYYEPFNDNKLNDANKQITKELNTIMERADLCSRDAGDCEFYSPTYPPESLIPKRKKGTTGTGIKKKPVVFTPTLTWNTVLEKLAVVKKLEARKAPREEIDKAIADYANANARWIQIQQQMAKSRKK